jgi:AcrR family transcriptional regulator
VARVRASKTRTAKVPAAEPRRQPLQERARKTVDAILTATARLLVREGYARMTTNRVAQVAGVSIGSVYQFFPGKDALIGAVIDRHRERVWSLMRERLAAAGDAPLSELIRLMARTAVELDTEDPALTRAFLGELHRTGRVRRLTLQSEREGIELWRSVLASRPDEVRVRDPETALFAMLIAGNAILRAALADRPDLIEDRERLVEVIADMATRFLVR